MCGEGVAEWPRLTATTWGNDEASWPHYGRKRLFVVAERDVHMGTLRALRLPEHPPALRRKLAGRRGEKLVVEQVPWFLPPVFQSSRGGRRCMG